MTRVLVVDDSAFMRHSISRVLASQPDIEVIGAASDGIEGLDLVRRLRPDVVTLDVEMPRMDGLRMLEVLMRDQPMPVVMLSSLTHDGAPATIRALELGAIEFVAKPAPPAVGALQIERQLVHAIRAAAQGRIHHRPLPHIAPQQGVAGGRNGKPALPEGAAAERLVVIGCSTGGPRALMEVLPRLPGNLPAGVLIVQHMPAGFTRSLAARLDGASALHVREAAHGDVVTPGLALLAPGGFHMVLTAGGRVSLHEGPTVHGVRPSVDVLLNSAPAVACGAMIVAILTGMGSDGADGAATVKARGARVIAEDASTAAVYGMPRAVFERGLADKQAPLPDIAAAITDAVLQRPARASQGA